MILDVVGSNPTGRPSNLPVMSVPPAVFDADEVQAQAISSGRFQYNVEVMAGNPAEKPLPKQIHQLIQQRIYDLLKQHLPDFEIYQQLNYRCGGDLRIPDVCVVSRDSIYLDGDLASPAELCVEIQSPGQSIDSLLLKCSAYIETGTRTCWVISPLERALYVPGSGQSVERYEETVSSDFAPSTVTIDLVSLFANLPAQA